MIWSSLCQRLRGLPMPLAGLALGLTGLGVTLDHALYLNGLGRDLACIPALILVLLLVIKYVLHPKLFLEDLRHPILGSLPPAATMVLMVAGKSLSVRCPLAGEIWWLTALVLDALLMCAFALAQGRALLRISVSSPSWFLPFVGLIMAAATVPSPRLEPLAGVLQLFGLVYFTTLPLALWKLIVLPPYPDALKPVVAIVVAPPSLLLVGWLTLHPESWPFWANILLVLALILAFSLYRHIYLLLNLPFTPALASLTFPLSISATALYKSSVHVPWLLPLAHMETIVSVLVTSSVCLRFIVHYSSRLLGRG